ncbi:MAG: 4Fe-4S binding protein [Muribaculaceae bacterium]|nr:4Fe-4S binding protein [Muribaculaceae bacterium]
MKSHLLKFVRIVLAILSIIVITLLFVDFTGWSAAMLSFMADIQFVPALLAINIVALIFLALITLIFGRLYCSVICPLGISQDVIAWLRRCFTPHRKRKAGIYRYEKENKVLRYIFLSIFLLLAVLGLASLLPISVAGILDPYSAYGRIVGQTIVPACHYYATVMGLRQASVGNYIFDSAPQLSGHINIAIAIVAAITFIVVAAFAITSGRGYCNKICPVGTILGFLSRYSLLKPVIYTDKCNRCGSCSRHCKAQCIDSKSHAIDYSRCVVCLDCINSCKQGALSYRRAPKVTVIKEESHIDNTRRNFLIGGATIAGSFVASAASGKILDGGLTPLKDKQSHKDISPTLPAGAISHSHFRSHCTACQLCVNECPEHILRPVITLEGFMQPTMSFTESFCRTECVRCSQVCPTGAITPIDEALKTSIKIGTAHVDATICLSATEGVDCGNCQRHCPVDAISMIDDKNGHKRPVVNEGACIGCGSCEYHCPVGNIEQYAANHAAIYVEGLKQHQSI